MADGGEDMAAIFAPGSRGSFPVRGGIDIRLVHWLSGTLAEQYASPLRL